MGKSQRTKGAVYEREVAQTFSDELGKKFERNIGQARDGGNDIDIGCLVVECKRRKSLKTILGWYRQASAAAYDRERRSEGAPVTHPVVVMREDNGESMVFLSLIDFLVLAGDKIAR